jgi:hypothetical protein
MPVPSWVVNTATFKQYTFYGYLVSQPTAWTAFSLFFALAIVHTGLTLRFVNLRSYWWMLIPSITGIFEGLGYLFRVLAANEWTLANLMCTILFLLVPPIALAIVNYELLGKVMRVADVQVGCLSSTSITRTFLTLDIACFIIQCCSAPLMLSGEPAKIREGTDIILAGLALQFAVFSAFVVASLLVMYHPKLAADAVPKNISFSLRLCLITIMLMLLRNAFRLYEYAWAYSESSKRRTSIVEHEEVSFYFLEFVPIFAVHVVFAVWNFGWLLPSDEELRAQLKGPVSSSSPDDGEPRAIVPTIYSL